MIARLLGVLVCAALASCGGDAVPAPAPSSAPSALPAPPSEPLVPAADPPPTTELAIALGAAFGCVLLPPGVVECFSAWLVEHDVADTKQIAEGFADPATRELARLQIQAEVLNAAFGQEARHRALIQGDRQVAEALAQFERARGLLASRQAAAAAGELGRRPNRPAREATAESGPEIPPVVRPGSDG
jgi:hypothetical protein